MRRRAFLGLCGVGLAALWQSSAQTLAAAGSLKIGLSGSLFPNLSQSLLSTATRPFRTLLEEATGYSGTIVTGGTPSVLSAKLKQDEVQLGVFQGIEFAWAMQSNSGLKPIVICVSEKHILKACLIVRNDSPVSRVADLRDTTLILAKETREHCKAFVRQRGVAPGTTPKAFYKKILWAGHADEALDMVAEGDATVALVDEGAWLRYRTEWPDEAKTLRVLEASEDFPCGIVACQDGRFSASQVSRFRDGLVQANSTRNGKRTMNYLGLSGFVEVPAYYDKLFASIAKTYPAQSN